MAPVFYYLKKDLMVREEKVIEVDHTEYTVVEEDGIDPKEPTVNSTDSGVGYRDLFSKTGQEIPKTPADPIKTLEDEQEVLVNLYASPFSYWWCEVKERVRSAFVKPKRDPFIASFFEPENPSQNQTYGQR